MTEAITEPIKEYKIDYKNPKTIKALLFGFNLVFNPGECLISVYMDKDGKFYKREIDFRNTKDIQIKELTQEQFEQELLTYRINLESAIGTKLQEIRPALEVTTELEEILGLKDTFNSRLAGLIDGESTKV